MEDHNPYGDDADDNLGLMPPNELDMAREVIPSGGVAATANIIIMKNSEKQEEDDQTGKDN